MKEQSYQDKNIDDTQNYLKKKTKDTFSLQWETDCIFPSEDSIQMTKAKLNIIL